MHFFFLFIFDLVVIKSVRFIVHIFLGQFILNFIYSQKCYITYSVFLCCKNLYYNSICLIFFEILVTFSALLFKKNTCPYTFKTHYTYDLLNRIIYTLKEFQFHKLSFVNVTLNIDIEAYYSLT